jgi:hypothetical protein
MDRLEASSPQGQLAGAGSDLEEATTLSTCAKRENGAALPSEVQGHPMIAGIDHGAPFHQSFEPQQQ